MLNAVPEAVNHQTRMVTLYHPNAIDCTVMRKQVKRVEQVAGQPSTAMGMPTLGGMGVLKSEDESDFEYVPLGAGKCLFCGVYTPTDVNERGDAVLLADAQQAQIESIAEPGQLGYFVIDTGDLVLLTPGLGVVLANTVEGFTGNMSIPPYTQRAILNPRDDLSNLIPVTP